MSHYVLSDLHGELDRFLRMLDLIHFSNQDRLYVLGDVIDRGPDGISILRMIMKSPNMTMLLGNHEYMCLRYYAADATEREIRHWNINSNAPTIAGFNALTSSQREELFQFLRNLPTHMELWISGRQFYLVHGFPGSTPYEEVWGRPLPDTPNPIPGATAIIGHTPVSYLGRDDDREQEYLAQLSERGEHLRIFHAPGFIDLDCCCGYPMPARSLACLRLEDMKEFYID